MSQFFFILVLVLILVMVFFIFSKSNLWSELTFGSFECGFSSYFFSRFSYSIHFILIGLIFLFLDLELCFLLPFFVEDISSTMYLFMFSAFLLVLIGGYLEEWRLGKMQWYL